MDNALQELTNGGDGGGVLVWFFEMLWRVKPRPADEYLYHHALPIIPDTVLLNFSRIRCWYFTPRTRAVRDAVASAAGTTSSSRLDDAAVGDAVPTSPVDQPQSHALLLQEDAADGDDGTSRGATGAGPVARNPVQKKSRTHLTGKTILDAFAGERNAAVNDSEASAADRSPRRSQAAGGSPQHLSRRQRAVHHRIIAMLICRVSAPNATVTTVAPGSTAAAAAVVKERVLDTAGPLQPRITYLNAASLRHFLFHSSLGETALLQHFPWQATASGEGATVQVNETLAVTWQWSSVVVNRSRSTFDLEAEAARVAASAGDATVAAATSSSNVGSATTFGAPYSSMVGTASIAEPLKRACNAIAEHVQAVSELQVVRMSAVFNLDAKGRLRLLFLQSASCAPSNRLFRAPTVACPESLVSALLFSGRKKTSSEYGGESQPSSGVKVTLMTRATKKDLEAKVRLAEGVVERRAQREADEEHERKCYGATSLAVREELANARFDRLAPEAWRHARARRGLLVERVRIQQQQLANQSLRRKRSPVSSPLAAPAVQPAPLAHGRPQSAASGHSSGPHTRPGSAHPSRAARSTSIAFFPDEGFEDFNGSKTPSLLHSRSPRSASWQPPPQAPLMHETIAGVDVGPLTPRSRLAATRKATRRLDMNHPATIGVMVANDATFTTSRVDDTLLRKRVSTNLYDKTSFASDAGRMGIADAYVASMGAYSTGKPVLDPKTKGLLSEFHRKQARLEQLLKSMQS